MPKIIRSPLSGTFHRKAAPDKPPYIEVGQRIERGDVIGLVEVMKSFHEVPSQEQGKVIRILVETEAAVQADDPLVELE